VSGISKIENILPSPDTENMVQACRALGATIVRSEDCLFVTGIGASRLLRSSQIDAGNSGIVLRFIGGVAALFGEPVTITGDDSTKERRSCSALLDGLKQLGAVVDSVSQGHTPISICGPIRAGYVTVDGRDSQPISALLIACSLFGEKKNSQITVRNFGEKPWVQLTVDWLRRMGVTIYEDEQSSFSTFYIQSREQPYFPAFTYKVPGDLSALAFMVVAALIRNTDLIMTGVDFADLQGDKKVIQILEAMGACFAIDHKQQRLRVRGPQQLRGMKINVNDCVDAVTILAVVGTYAQGVTTISGAEIARDKECDRLRAITTELRKMGAKIEEHQDGLTIYESSLHAAPLDSHNDHRMAMSLAIAALRAKEPCTIAGSECVRKSYPTFFTDLKKLFQHL
jgi:3-phosphoshikimate 1-carboxyvinyltransferase